MTEELPRELLADAATLRLYALCTTLNLFELACLVHGCNPKAIAHRAHDNLTTYRREALGINAPPMSEEVLELVEVVPERLGEPVGATLAALKLVSRSNTIRRKLDRAEARRLVERLGYHLPDELGIAETPAERAKRRLARFYQLGGSLRRAGSTWHIDGKRGALAELAREEAQSGMPQSARQDVTRDLHAAATAQMQC